MRSSRAWICFLSLATGSGIILQWILVWSGAFPVSESVPGFRNYFLCFVAADLWLVVASFMTGTLLLLKDPRALLFGRAHVRSQYRPAVRLLSGELFGKAVTLYNLLVGVLLMVLSWRDRTSSGPTSASSRVQGGRSLLGSFRAAQAHHVGRCQQRPRESSFD